MTALVWFRRDLRLHDNPALSAALAAHDVVVPVFCLDRRLLDGPHRSSSRSDFMRSCLVCLDESLRELGSQLVIRDGPPHVEIPAVAASVEASEVFAAHDVSPFARARDRGVAAALESAGARLRLRPGIFVVDDLGSIRTGAGDPYTVFTPFYRRWSSASRRALEPAPDKLPALSSQLRSDPLPELGEQPMQLAVDAGESAARRRLAQFIENDLESYAEHHDDLGADATSHLSAYLHFGCLSPREVEHRVDRHEGGEPLTRQLCWRDFYGHVLLHHPDNARFEHQAKYRRRLDFTNDRELFDAWREGRTGYPLVDAAMRELVETGVMHNRARMVVGSFLVKDLAIDWRWGERWFMRCLIDGDEANNNGNWQWIASVGVDPQPPTRRIYNPTLQQRRFDPDGHYVRRHVPELAEVPDEFLAEPWTMPEAVQESCGCVIGRDYPAPIVDHANARREAIERYAAAARTDP